MQSYNNKKFTEWGLFEDYPNYFVVRVFEDEVIEKFRTIVDRRNKINFIILICFIIFLSFFRNVNVGYVSIIFFIISIIFFLILFYLIGFIEQKLIIATRKDAVKYGKFVSSRSFIVDTDGDTSNTINPVNPNDPIIFIGFFFPFQEDFENKIGIIQEKLTLSGWQINLEPLPNKLPKNIVKEKEKYIPVAVTSSYKLYPLIDLAEFNIIQKLLNSSFLPYKFFSQIEVYNLNRSFNDTKDNNEQWFRNEGFECEYGYIYVG